MGVFYVYEINNLYEEKKYGFKIIQGILIPF